MFFAPISLKSLSASYFRSFDTLNLKIQNKAHSVSYSRSKGRARTFVRRQMTLNLSHRVTGVSALTNPNTLTRLLFFCLTSNFHRLFQLWSFLFLHQHHHLSRIQLCLHWAGMFHVAVGERTKNLYPFSRTHHRGLSEKSKHKKHPIGGDQWSKQTPGSRKRGFYLGRAQHPSCIM